MRRAWILTAITILLDPCALGQSQVLWNNNVAQAVQQAKSSGHPLMFWVWWSPDCGESTLSEKTLQPLRTALRDPRVVELSQRFVTCKIQYEQNKKQVEGWDAGMFCIVFTTPTGEKLDMLCPENNLRTEEVLKAVTGAYRKYRDQVFDKSIRTTLVKSDAQPGELRQALQQVERLLPPAADQPVISLLGRASLDRSVREKALGVLAKLSTDKAIDALLSASLTDKTAAGLLDQCTPVGAQRMLESFTGAKVRPEVYRAVTTICKINAPKNDGFWKADNAKAQQDELERVRKLTAQTARKWKEQNELYR